jgi:lipopolysaccharide transport system permease protein
MRHFSVSPIEMMVTIWRARGLVWSMIRREVVGRYRGSVMGLLWSFFNPVLMLAVYTFVFSVVFKARWVGGSDSKTEFALVLFAGLMVFNLFSECVNRAPSLIISNVNFVKKVIFPLEILPIVAFGSAAFHFFVSTVVWFVFYLIFFTKLTLLMIKLGSSSASTGDTSNCLYGAGSFLVPCFVGCLLA